MKDSPLDLEGKTAWGTVDNNPASHFYMADWDDGGEYTDFNNKGFTFEFYERIYGYNWVPGSDGTGKFHTVTEILG